jgi:hypothetical protein
LIPTQWSEFEAEVPEFVSYRKMSLGHEALVINEAKTESASFNVTFRTRENDRVSATEVHNERVRYNKNVMHFAQEKVPALKLEKFSSSHHDYLSRIIFEVNAIYNTDFSYVGTEYVMTTGMPKSNTFTWNSIAKEMYEEIFSTWVEQEKHLDVKVVENAKTKATETEKAQAIIDYFDKNFQINEYNYIFPSQTVRDCATSHKGSATDINLLFISYLKKVGLKAYPVMISTKEHGRVISFYPNYFAFNKVLSCVVLDNKETLIDAAILKLPLGLIPSEDLNDEGLLIQDKNNARWIKLENKVASRFATYSNLTINKDGTLKGAMSISSSGYLAEAHRNTYKNGNEAAYFKEVLKEITEDATFTNKKLENMENWQEPNLKVTFDISTTSFINVAGDKTLSFANNEHQFKEAERKYDIYLPYTSEQILSYSYTIPEGYKIEALPKSTKLALDENGIMFDYIVDNTTANQLKINVKYRVKKVHFLVEEYTDLRNFFNQIIAKLGEQVILTKI